jgi:site-specific DNA recombinase
VARSLDRPADGTTTGKTVGYFRVSTERQAEEGFSLDTQEETARRYAADHGWELAAVYPEAESGGKDDRRMLTRLLADAKRGGIKRVLVWKFDRLSRGGVASMSAIVAELRRCGVQVVSVTEQLDPDTAVGEVILAVYASAARMEREAISERVAANAQARVRRSGQVYGGRYAPYGFDRVGEPKQRRLVPNAVEAVHAGRMFVDADGGVPVRRIARNLNEAGVPSKSGGRWSAQTVHDILRNPVYVGGVKLRDKVIEGAQPALIERDLFDRVQVLLDAVGQSKGQGRGRRPTRHLFRDGFVRCGCCGGSIKPVRRTRRNGDDADTYECGTRRSDGVEACPMPPLPRQVIEQAVLDYFEAVVLDVERSREDIARNVAAQVADVTVLRKQAERQVLEAEAALDKAEREWRTGELSGAMFERLAEKFADERAAAEAEAAQLIEREREVAEQASLRDAEAELLDGLVQLRHAILADVQHADGVQALRAALLRCFTGFVLHCLAEHVQARATLPLPGWWQPELLVPGHGALYLEPQVRADALADNLGPWPNVARIPLNHAEREMQELDSVGDHLESAPAGAVGCLPGTASEPAVQRRSIALVQELPAQVRLPVPDGDPHEVGAAFLARPVDGQEEARQPLALGELLHLDLRREIADQRDDVHANDGTP